ncbi:MAG: CopG family antitoxin [Cyanobacteria bacterium P01_C01_bin.120]
MSDKTKASEPIPEEFASYEAAARFWEHHDTTDYLDDFETVQSETELRQRYFEIQIDDDLMQVLYQQAQRQGVDINQLVNDVLRKSLKHAA